MQIKKRRKEHFRELKTTLDKSQFQTNRRKNSEIKFQEQLVEMFSITLSAYSTRNPNKQFHTSTKQESENQTNMTYIQSNIGGRIENQYFYGSAQTKFGELIVVCDGIGGHNGGRYAAEKAVQIIIDEVSTCIETIPTKALQKAILKANNEIWQQSNIN